MRRNKHCRPGAAALSARGFTLIELAIVLVVMGIVIAFAGPRIAGGLTGQGVRTAALQTAAMLRYARSKAVNTGCRYHVMFDGGGRRVIFLQGSLEDMAGRQSSGGGFADGDGPLPDGLEGADAAAGPAEQEMREYLLPEGVFFENVAIADIESAGFGDEAVMLLTFYPSGMSPGAVVTIADERGRRFFITVDTIAGGVRVDQEQDNA
jgi:prepilin-type N-terminal cleavage/methylation domain-containing protein